MRLSGMKILLTQAHLIRYQGSEIVTLELAEYFAGEGAEVLVVTHAIGHPASDGLQGMAGVTLLQLDDPALEENLRDRLPDLAWVHHSMLPMAVLEHAERIVFVFHHMSSILAAEFSMAAALETELATAVLFESPKSRDVHVATGIYDDLPAERLQVMGNPASPGFAAQRRGDGTGRILVVSNHIAPEVREAVDSLRDDFEVTLVGSQRDLGAEPQRVTPDLIASADAVVTIGKTVQYSMVVGTPVYVYDQFGGPGWLDQDNLEQTAYENFSGRGFASKSAAEIAAEIRDGLAEARVRADELRILALRRYELSARIETLLEYIEAHRRDVAPIDRRRARAHDLVQQAFGSYVRELSRVQRDAEFLRGDVAGLTDALANVERDFDRVTTKPLVKLALKASR